jgi:glycosyltransferase involved in cell wall biosynthesis
MFPIHQKYLMQQVDEVERAQTPRHAVLPVSVIIPTRNEARNLPRCLESVRNVAEVYVIDSQSTDATPEIARQFGAKVVQFHYHGGWPKKRQWAMNILPLCCDWVLLLDADEVLTPDLLEEMRQTIERGEHDGYYIALDMHFLGRRLRHGDSRLWKLALFRRGRGQFECRLQDQNASMGDMEVHEHVIVRGHTSQLKNRLIHHNENSLSDYIHKHNEYSNWEARVWTGRPEGDELPAKICGTQAQRRRWLKKQFFGFPGSPFLYFFYKYFFRCGFLDGVPGLIYCCFQGIQFFHVKAKMYELRKAKSRACAELAV